VAEREIAGHKTRREIDLPLPIEGIRAALSEDQFVLTLTGPKMIAWPDRSAGVRGELAQRATLQHFALANRPSRPRAF
jgi:hypothetical protein